MIYNQPFGLLFGGGLPDGAKLLEDTNFYWFAHLASPPEPPEQLMEEGSMLASVALHTFSPVCAHFRGWKHQLSLVFAWLTCLRCLPYRRCLLFLGGPAWLTGEATQLCEMTNPGLAEPLARG